MKIEDIKVGSWYTNGAFFRVVAIEESVVFYLYYDGKGRFRHGNALPLLEESFRDWEEIEEPLFAKKPEVIESKGEFYCRIDDSEKPHSENSLLDFVLGRYCLDSGFSSLKKTKAIRKRSQKIFKVKFSVKATEIVEGVNDEI